jgi:hypothetical protein
MSVALNISVLILVRLVGGAASLWEHRFLQGRRTARGHQDTQTHFFAEIFAEGKERPSRHFERAELVFEKRPLARHCDEGEGLAEMRRGFCPPATLGGESTTSGVEQVVAAEPAHFMQRCQSGLRTVRAADGDGAV